MPCLTKASSHYAAISLPSKNLILGYTDRVQFVEIADAVGLLLHLSSPFRLGIFKKGQYVRELRWLLRSVGGKHRLER